MRLQGTLLFGALTVALSLGVALTPRAAFSEGREMVQYAQSSEVLLPDGRMSDPDATITTLSAERERTDDQFGTFVIECDRRRTISWRALDKSYVVESFDELAQQDAQIAASMRANGKSESVATPHDAPDAKTTIIDGLTAHHFVETMIALPNDSLGTSVSDVWYTAGADPFVCRAFDAIAPRGNRITTSISSGGGPAGVTMVSSSIISGAGLPAGAVVLRKSTRVGHEVNVITEVTAVKKLPYDPTYFEPPAGFVQATPRALPSFPPR